VRARAQSVAVPHVHSLFDSSAFEVVHEVATPGIVASCNGIAVTMDGASFVVTDSVSHSLCVFSVWDGLPRHIIAGPSSGSPRHFARPKQLWVSRSAAGCVFLADRDNNAVHILRANLTFHSSIYSRLSTPAGVCGNRRVVIVSEEATHRIALCDRGSEGTPARWVGGRGRGDGELNSPAGMCLLTDELAFAVADRLNDRVCVFLVDGTFQRHVGVGVLRLPSGVACSPSDELVVADTGNARLCLFGASGELLHSFGTGAFTGVAVYAGTVFAQDADGEKCVLFA
jgi:sugar lactone lactonase YvrE